MDELNIKEKIVNAMAEPPAPKALVEKTVVRVNAILSGRRAEQELQKLGNAPPGDTVRQLAATSVIGRLMQSIPPPERATPAELAESLLEQPQFRKLTDRPADQILHDLSSGKLNRALGEAGPVKKNENPRPAAEKGPRESGGPSM